MAITSELARALAAGMTLAAAIPAAGPAGASTAQQVELSPSDPVIWSGTVAGATGPGTVVVHAMPSPRLFAKPGDSASPIVLGTAEIGADATATVRVRPGTWLKNARFDDGRVRLFVTASGDGGRRIGVATLDVVWQPAGRTGGSASSGSWSIPGGGRMSPSATASDVAAAGSATADATLRTVDGAPAPSSVVELEAAPPEVTRALGAAPTGATAPGGAVQAAAAVGSPPGFICNGPVTYEAAAPTWVTLGKYWAGGGSPRETATYQRTNTTTSSIGTKVGASAGVFSITGSASSAVTTTNAAFGSSQVQGDGTNRYLEFMAKYNYRRYRHSSCWYSSSTPPANPGYWFSVYSLQPHNWTGDVVFFGGAGDQPTGGTVRALAPNQSIGRTSGVSTEITEAFELTVGPSALTGNARVSTSSAAGNQVTRAWFNPSAGGSKYVAGLGGDPQWTGVAGVRGWA